MLPLQRPRLLSFIVPAARFGHIDASRCELRGSLPVAYAYQHRLVNGYDVKTGEDLGGLSFSIDWKELFRSNTHKRAGDGRWRASTLPLPLVFQPLDEQADAQAGVIVL